MKLKVTVAAGGPARNGNQVLMPQLGFRDSPLRSAKGGTYKEGRAESQARWQQLNGLWEAILSREAGDPRSFWADFVDSGLPPKAS